MDFDFDQLDIVAVLQGGKYLTGLEATWGDGDWTGDMLFDQLDIVAALQGGNYLMGPYAAKEAVTVAVPEPSASAMFLFEPVGLLAIGRRQLI